MLLLVTMFQNPKTDTYVCFDKAKPLTYKKNELIDTLPSIYFQAPVKSRSQLEEVGMLSFAKQNKKYTITFAPFQKSNPMECLEWDIDTKNRRFSIAFPDENGDLSLKHTTLERDYVMNDLLLNGSCTGIFETAKKTNANNRPLFKPYEVQDRVKSIEHAINVEESELLFKCDLMQKMYFPDSFFF